MVTKRKPEKAPPIDKLLKPAIGVGLALLGYQFIKGLNSEIIRVNVHDDLELKEVFFGEGAGKSYAVLCHEENSKVPVSSVFQDAFNAGTTTAEFRVLDCNYVLPSSEKTVAERFKLDLKKRPTVFVSGKVGPPKQVPNKHLKTGAMLVKLLRNMLEPRAAKVETTQDLRTKCLDKEYCGLLLKGSKSVPNYVKTAMSKLVQEHPKVSFASVDTSVLYVKNLEEYLPELEGQQPRFVVFQKVSGSSEAKSERLKTSIAPLPTNGVSYAQMNDLVTNVLNKSQEMNKISTLPVIKTRTKKLVEEEKAKRQRRLDQKSRQHEQTTPGGYFTPNDGSREGRRAERERRRAEHYAAHGIKEKTPEEIAEMERKRRIRMEEEAAKWNMAPDDAPEEGEPVFDDYMEDVEDGETYVVEEDDEQQGDDEEDIMDLD